MKTVLFALCFSLTACGGAIDSGLDGGADGGGADSGKDAAQNDGSPAQDGGSPDCDALGAELASEAQAAEQCCPTCNVIQCSQQVDGVCCPLTVSMSNQQAVQTYEATLTQFRANGCVSNCPAIACSTKPSESCIGNGSSGTCAQF